MIDESSRLLQLANSRLSRGRVGVAIEMRGVGGWLYLRGTFPPKPGSRRSQPYQQRIALKMRGTNAAIKEAEGIAKVVGGELNLGRFDWGKWSDAEDETKPQTVEHYVRQFEEKWWRSRDRANPSNVNTWNKNYRVGIKRLPLEQELTTDLLIDWVIENSGPDQVRTRNNYCTMARELATLAGLPAEVFKELSASGGIKPINPRDLPSDAAIEEAIASIVDPGWRYLVGVMACYGLRNHECFGLNHDEFPILRVRRGTKTGERPVAPLHPHWPKLWGLHEAVLPEGLRDVAIASNERLGNKISRWFYHNLEFSAYNLRHSFARRCAEYGIETETAAALMGHSPQIHTVVYRCWIGEKVRLDRYRAAIGSVPTLERPLNKS